MDMYYLLPHFLLWDPLMKFTHEISNGSLTQAWDQIFKGAYVSCHSHQSSHGLEAGVDNHQNTFSTCDHHVI